MVVTTMAGTNAPHADRNRIGGPTLRVTTQIQIHWLCQIPPAPAMAQVDVGPDRRRGDLARHVSGRRGSIGRQRPLGLVGLVPALDAKDVEIAVLQASVDRAPTPGRPTAIHLDPPNGC